MTCLRLEELSDKESFFSWQATIYKELSFTQESHLVFNLRMTSNSVLDEFKRFGTFGTFANYEKCQKQFLYGSSARLEIETGFRYFFAK